MHFPELIYLNFNKRFTYICPGGSNWQEVTILFGDGLVPNKRQATVGTDDDLLIWDIYISSGLIR